jgi:putative spermidine/putrescine transport system permease protein
MRLSPASRWGLRVAVAITLAFIYIPLVMVVIYAFSSSSTLEWPPPGWTADWVGKAIDNAGARDALLASVKVALLATAVALILGTLAALAVGRHRFFGRETISFLVILPIALPGIVTAIALNSTFTEIFGIDLSLFTVVVGHATFCIVVVYNNVVARLRRTSGSFAEASADLGAPPWQTFLRVTLPNMRGAIVAGALLSFALSFDEIVVTTFTLGGEKTLPIWFFENFARPNNLPEVYVIAMFVILLSIIPVYIAHRLSSDPAGGRGGGGGAVEAEATAMP